MLEMFFWFAGPAIIGIAMIEVVFGLMFGGE